MRHFFIWPSLPVFMFTPSVLQCSSVRSYVCVKSHLEYSLPWMSFSSPCTFTYNKVTRIQSQLFPAYLQVRLGWKNPQKKWERTRKCFVWPVHDDPGSSLLQCNRIKESRRIWFAWTLMVSKEFTYMWNWMFN